MADYARCSDAELIHHCLAEDAAAWEALVRRYQRLIGSITFKFALSAEDAADVLQAVFLTLFQQLAQLNPQAKLSSWIITVTVRECYKLRARSPQTQTPADIEWNPADDTPLPDAALVRLERQHLVRQAIAALPDRCHALLRRLFYSDAPPSYADLSRELGLPVPSIGPTRARCLDKLKEMLAAGGFI